MGIAGGCGDADGPGAIARFSQLAGLAVHRSTGVLYVADLQTIKRIAPSGVVSTFAGRNDGLFTPWRDGVGTNARFAYPIEGLAVDSRGNLFVVGAGPLRKVSPSGLVTTFFAGGGQGISVAPDDSLWMVVGGSNEPSTLVHLSSLGQPLASMALAVGVRGVAVTAAGRIFVSGAPNAALSELLSDGGLEARVGATVVLSDGGQMSFGSFPGPRLGGLTPDGRSIVLFGGGLGWRGVALFDLDGALRSVTEMTSLVGTIDNAFVGVDRDGLTYIAQGCSVAILRPDGGEATFAGGYRATPGLVAFPEPPQDGPIAAARLGLPTWLVQHPATGFLVADVALSPQFHSVWKWVHDGVVSPFLSRSGPMTLHRGELWTYATASDGGGLLQQLTPAGNVARSFDAPPTRGFQALRLASSPGGLVLVESGPLPDVDVFQIDPDGGVVHLTIPTGPNLPTVGGVVSDGADGLFLSLASGMDAGVWHLVDGGVTFFSSLAAPASLARTASGELLATEGFRVVRIDSAGQSTTVAQLSDAPVDLLVEDGGSVLVTVRRAVLRLRP